MTRDANDDMLPPDYAPRSPEAPAKAQGNVARSVLFWVATLALLALFALALWRQQEHSRQAEQRIGALNSRIETLQQDLQQRKNAAQAEQQVFEQTMQQYTEALESIRAEVSGGAQAFAEAQRMHAASYLVHHASLHIRLGRDIDGAKAALNSALSELQLATSERANQLRAAITADLQTLAQVQITSPLMLARELNELQVRVNQLEPLRSTLGNGDKGLNLIEAQDGWLGYLKQSWDQYAGDWFVVRRYDEVVNTPPDALENRRIKLAISLAISEAQLASVHADPLLYTEALKRARGYLLAFYSNTDQGEALQQAIDQLLNKTIARDDFELTSAQETKW